MNKHIKQLQLYISTRRKPFIQSAFFKLCKEMYTNNEDMFKKMIDDILTESDGKKTCSKNTIVSILRQVGSDNRGREVSSFVFAVFAKATCDLDFDITEVLPNIDYESDELVNGDFAIIKSLVLGLLVGGWLVTSFY